MANYPRRPVLLNLFCKAGGAAVGYASAGFTIRGIDLEPQPRYPFPFICGDALGILRSLTSQGPGDIAAIHASPPCQAYSLARNNGCHPDAPRLIAPVRALLEELGLPFVIENVEGARKELRSPALVCGAQFGLGAAGMDLPRHRLFETNWPLVSLGCSHKRGNTLGVYGHGTNSWHREKLGRNIYQREKEQAMGITWMNRRELSEAIPPAYTEFIGRQLLTFISNAESSSPAYAIGQRSRV